MDKARGDWGVTHAAALVDKIVARLADTLDIGCKLERNHIHVNDLCV